MIRWLAKMEKRAASMYEKALTAFPYDSELTALLVSLHHDEMVHAEIMEQAGRLQEPGMGQTPLLFIDETSRREPEGFFIACEKLLERQEIDKASFVECLVSAEFSEYNELFLYVVNALKRAHKDFIPSVVKMEQHRKTIERYLSSNPEYLGLLKRIKRLPRLWDEKFLVVDDSTSITDVLMSLLEDQGEIITAHNGRKALDLLGTTYFSIIISEIDMPVMDGIEFCREAMRMFPDIHDRFIFFSSTADESALAFIRENRIRLIEKPTSIKRLMSAVVEIIGR